MDIQKIPAIQQKRIVTFVNNFIIDTVSHLNKFITSSENTLWRLEKRMQKLEMTLKLLEVKLNFIPESEQKENSATVTPQPTENAIHDVLLPQPDEVPNSDEVDLTEASPAKAVPEEVQKYFKMVQVGVPVQAVKLKMERDGFDPTLLD